VGERWDVHDAHATDHLLAPISGTAALRAVPHRGWIRRGQEPAAPPRAWHASEFRRLRSIDIAERSGAEADSYEHRVVAMSLRLDL
jgi:hypothetical protein